MSHVINVYRRRIIESDSDSDIENQQETMSEFTASQASQGTKPNTVPDVRRFFGSDDGGSDGECSGQPSPKSRRTSVGDGSVVSKASAGRAQFKYWVATVNNWRQSDLDRIAQLHADGYSSHVAYQPEVGESGTKHLQCVFTFKTKRELGPLKKKYGSHWHWEPMRADYSKALEYCRKEETRDPDAGFGFTEFGTAPVGAGIQGNRSDLAGAIALIRGGATQLEVLEAHPATFVRNVRGLTHAIALLERRRDFKTTIRWYYGPTGTGKSRAAFDEAPTAYWKDASNHWWDFYGGNENVIIDDYRCSFCQFNQLLRYFDRYPMRVEFKGGSCEFVAKTIYVTAPNSPEFMWAGRTEEDLSQLLRRIEVVRKYSVDGSFEEVKNTLAVDV